MKVNQTNSRGGSPGSVSSLNGVSGAVPMGKAAAALSQAAQEDGTQISQLSAHLAAAVSGSAVYAAKLDRLNASVGSGSYQVDAGAVSEDIIQHSLLFGAAW